MASEKKADKKIGANLQAVKGMRDITGDEYYKFQGFFEKAQEVSEYYGFKPIETPMVEYSDVFTTAIGEGTDVVDKEMYSFKTKGGDMIAMRPEHTAGTMRSYIENGMANQPQPVLLYTYGPSFRHDTPQKGRYRQFYQFDLDALGSEKSIVDALVIKTMYTILEEAGAKDLSVDINSIGDKECRGRYIRELTNYYKKHLKDLPAVDKERLAGNPLRILDSKEAKTIEINEDAPDAVSYLCPACKKHFKEVLEYLEEMEIPYSINKNLVRGLSYYTRTVFEIIQDIAEEGGESKKLTICGGGRYDYLGKMLGSKKDVPAMGAAIGVDRVVASSWYANLKPRIMKDPEAYFIQFGLEAKLKSLNIMEILRKAKFPVIQSISKDKLGSQLGHAEKLGVKYVMIFGQREALDNTVIVRNMETRSQDNVKIDDLKDYLKKLK
ncbi:MAG: Histidine--tRNA ligase [Patescibacteria group bacterium]|nr:Histidine--tRNA ligase [Patescibacteria group bacterium]